MPAVPDKMPEIIDFAAQELFEVLVLCPSAPLRAGERAAQSP
jgi:hypothetical protein